MRHSKSLLRALASTGGLAPLCVLIAALLLAPTVFAEPEEETPAEATSAAPASDDKPEPEDGADPGEEIASEPDEPLESEPAQAANIEEILIQGEASDFMVKDKTVSVISFDPGTLKVEGIRDIRDLSNFTPSLEIKSAFAASNPTIYIRGVGLDDFNANAATAVAIYQDGVYMQSPAGQLFQFYDVEGVQVLRGPQGTLYRNASAGAILIDSVKPSDEFTSYVETSYGNYNLTEVEGALGGPILPDVLSYRLSGTWSARDGITKNRCAADAGNPNRDEVNPVCNQASSHDPPRRFVDPQLEDWTNNIDAWAARGQLLFTAPLRESAMEWLLNVHGGKNNSRAFQYQHRGVRLNSVTEEPTRIGGTDSNGYKDRDGGDPFAGDYNIDGPEKIELWGVNLRGTWEFGDDAYELRSLTAYEWNDGFTLENTDAGPKKNLESQYFDSAWQFSQQLDLLGHFWESDFGEGDWTLGAFYLQEDLDVRNFFVQGGGANLDQVYNQKMWNFAPYLLAEYRLQPGCEPVSCDFTLTGGVRYNLEHKDFSTTVAELATSGAPPRESLDGEDDDLWTGVSGELTLAWNFTEASSLYMKYSRGWKGGHFNGGATSIFDIVTGVDPETVDSYEAGLRSYWFDDRLKLNISGFYYDYRDLQVFIISATKLGYPIPKLVNATDALIYGVELDLQAEPITGLHVTFNAAWVESEYEQFVITIPDLIRVPKDCRTCPPPDPINITVLRKFDYSGNELIASPRFSFSGSVAYEIPLPGEIAGAGLGVLTPRFSYSWKDELLFDACGGRGNRCNFDQGFFAQEAFWVLNAALIWNSENEGVSLTGWVRNLLDNHYKTQSFDYSRGLGIIADAYADPRTYGFTVSISF